MDNIRGNKRVGNQSIIFSAPVNIKGIGTVAGKKESEGPLGQYFDVRLEDCLENENSWELEERNMLENAINTVLKKTETLEKDVHFVVMGDLLNQIISASFTARDLAIPYIGVYGACSTMALSLSVASLLIDGGFANQVVAATCSHFCTAERQYRYPLEMGVQRVASSQWTVTGAGAVVLDGSKANGAAVSAITTGRVVDFQIEDANYMGAAMAPAAASTLRAHFEDTGRDPSYYDVILTGDLGIYGKDILCKLLLDYDGIDIHRNYIDCGCEIFKGDKTVMAGASGCGCSALYLSKVLNDLNKGNIQRALFISTGALLSPVSTLQKESIPGIAHAVAIENF